MTVSNKKIGSIRQLFQTIIGYIFIGLFLLLIFKGLVTWTNFSNKTLAYIITGLYGLFSLSVAYGDIFDSNNQ